MEKRRKKKGRKIARVVEKFVENLKNGVKNCGRGEVGRKKKGLIRNFNLKNRARRKENFDLKKAEEDEIIVEDEGREGGVY